MEATAAHTRTNAGATVCRDVSQKTEIKEPFWSDSYFVFWWPTRRPSHMPAGQGKSLEISGQAQVALKKQAATCALCGCNALANLQRSLPSFTSQEPCLRVQT